MTEWEKRFFRAKRALAHLMFADHNMSLRCSGCCEVAAFLTVSGYHGDEDCPVGVDFEVPR